jgi:hypothetical protein
MNTLCYTAKLSRLSMSISWMSIYHECQTIQLHIYICHVYTSVNTANQILCNWVVYVHTTCNYVYTWCTKQNCLWTRWPILEQPPLNCFHPSIRFCMSAVIFNWSLSPHISYILVKQSLALVQIAMPWKKH